MTEEPSVRQKILTAALDIVETNGVEALTQPRVAKAAGVRQSHLTYYFPRKADLFIALLEASHARASHQGRGGADDPIAEAKALMFDRRRMRFFLAIVLGASEEPELRPILAAHGRALAARVAGAFGRAADDPAAAAFLDSLRGLGLRMLLDPEAARVEDAQLERLAESLGLLRPPRGGED